MDFDLGDVAPRHERFPGIRPIGHELQPWGTELHTEILFSYLNRIGFNGDEVLYRSIASDRVQLALQTGTDRDETSTIDPGRGDGELAVARKHGMSDPTMLGHFWTLSRKQLRKIALAPETAVAIYDPSQLQRFPNYANTPFYRFRSPQSKGLLAVVEQRIIIGNAITDRHADGLTVTQAARIHTGRV